MDEVEKIRFDVLMSVILGTVIGCLPAIGFGLASKGDENLFFLLNSRDLI